MRAAGLLASRRMSGPLPFLIAVTMFFVLLASAAALALNGAAGRIEGADRLTAQIMAANPVRREAEAAAAVQALERSTEVSAVHRVPDEELQRLLEPWFGEAGTESLPTPVLIEVELAQGVGGDAVAALIRRHAPSAAVNADRQWLEPVERLVALLRWMAGSIALIAAAGAAVAVAWGARSELEKQQGTVGLLHLMGATDRQITSLFERRIAASVLAGGALGLLAAIPVLLLVGHRIESLESELMASGGGVSPGWLLLLIPPLLGTALSVLVARATLLQALRRL